MVRYYCDYCKSYLTHDTNSVRRSHLVGKNHIKIVADYYRNKKQHTLHSVAATLGTNKAKKTMRKLAHSHRKELGTFQAGNLAIVYKNSPGYDKIFVPKNRKDIGQYIRSSRLPQRSNEPSQPHRQPPLTSPALTRLPPPPQLTFKHQTQPKTQTAIYNTSN